MRITNIEYDVDKGVVRVEIELPAVGELTIKEARELLDVLIERILPER